MGALLGAWGLGAGAAVGQSVKAVGPRNTGPVKLLCASPYGGKGIDHFVGAGVLPDGSIVLAGNADLTKLKDGLGRGFLLRLRVADGAVRAERPTEVSGHIRRMKLDPAGNVCVLVEGAGVHVFRPGEARPLKTCEFRGVTDFGVDSNGELVVLHGAQMTRLDAAWRVKRWTVFWHAFGGNRPEAMDVCPKTGVAGVIGYGMTHTGREPWKDPFAYGFDRSGKQAWKLWDPDPKRQVGANFGGNGLMADTTGKLARAGGDGKLYLGLFADGGNSICTRSPADPDQAIDARVYDGVYQRGPGHGFKGASKTSVAFRADAATGALEKGTWMCAWLDRSRANALAMDALASDADGRVFIVGSSASNCPKMQPWYEYAAGYQGGGFLAVFDRNFAMVQCGAFQQTALTCVAVGSGYAVAAGHVKPPDADNSVNVWKPVQADLGGGEADGYFLIFQTGPRTGAGAAAEGKTSAAQALLDRRFTQGD